MATAEQEAQEILVADDAGDETEFSDLGESISSETTSLASEIRNYEYENGRRYHGYKSGKYAMPNDETEQERLDMLHHVYLLLLSGELHNAPTKPQLHRILDVGTGTGIWALDMACKHPEAVVIGVDLSPIQPSWVAVNCKFEIDDIEEPWTWSEKFDFIHARGMAQSIRDWPRFLSQSYSSLNPSGCILLVESELVLLSDDDSIPPDSRLALYFSQLQHAVEKFGVPDPCKRLHKYVEEAGFEEVNVRKIKLPWGGWPKEPRQKEIGRWTLAVLESGLKAYAEALFTRVLRMNPEEATRLCDDAFVDLKKRGTHAYNFQYYVTGIKKEK